MWRFTLPLGVFVALAIFFFIGLGRDPTELPSPLIGRPAPAFSLPSLRDSSQQISNAQFAGQPYLLNVWATWCAGCRQEHDMLLAIARSGVVPIIGLDWRDSRERALEWLNRLGDPYAAVAFDAEGQVAVDWGVYGAPETFLVGADGRVLHKHIAPLTPEIWERDFMPRIRQGRAR